MRTKAEALLSESERLEQQLHDLTERLMRFTEALQAELANTGGEDDRPDQRRPAND